MKKLLCFIVFSITSLSGIAGESLSLSCLGKTTVQIKKTDGNFEVIETENTSQSFLFKNGVLQKKIGNLKCDWTEEEIICLDFKKLSKDTTMQRTVNINRITGYVQSIQSSHVEDGTVFSITEFFGSCKAEKKKF
jgi:hypothetical protein